MQGLLLQGRGGRGSSSIREISVAKRKAFPPDGERRSYRLFQLVERFGKRLLTRLDIPPDRVVTLVAGELQRIMNPYGQKLETVFLGKVLTPPRSCFVWHAAQSITDTQD
jgi:hypothetical protein